MSLFDRKSKGAATAGAPELPPTLSFTDLSAASKLMDRWDAAMGNNDATWACIDAVAKLGGFRGLEALLGESGTGRQTEDIVNRPWRWWAEAARLANACGEYALAGRIFLFTYLFVNQMLPTMNAATQLDAGLGFPGQGTYESIARSAADCLTHLPSAMVIHDSTAGRVDVASALAMATSVAAERR
jgi:hypothetical protein